MQSALNAHRLSALEIDRVLCRKRKQREPKACYPCRQRKVKCDGGHPCRTCVRRDHPQICAYNVEKGASRSRPAGTLAGSTTEGQDRQSQAAQSSFLSSTASPGPGSPSVGTSSPVEHRRNPRSANDSLSPCAFSGDNSLVSMLRQQDPDGSMAREATSVLGLHNTYSTYPFLDSKTPQDQWVALLEILPHRDEVIKFFHFYRTNAYPFNPILADVDKFELDICIYLSAYASGELHDRSKVSNHWASSRSVSQISLLLAILAAGAHFSDLENPKRSELCQDFARRSFQALRLANFLFRPSIDVVQSMLILGNTLQNNGQSDAAWALLGTTVRLAQTLGLHSERGLAHWPVHAKARAKALWSMTIWQDSLLSLCYDRPPIVSIRGWKPHAVSDRQAQLSYTDLMHYLCWIALDILKMDGSSEEPTRNLALLGELDNTHNRAEPHLLRRENCRNLQQHLEHLALRMHISYCVSALCRPAIRASPLAADDPSYMVLRDRARQSLITASQAFLDFQAVSVVPLRTWSMQHTVLSSTLLLCTWQETRDDPECKELQQKVIEVFSGANSPGRDAGSSDYSQWLSARHIRALVTLRQTLRKRRDPIAALGQIDLTPGTVPTGSTVPNSGIGVGDFPSYNDFFGGLGYGLPSEMDFSPVTFLDSIMNGPLFDIPEDS